MINKKDNQKDMMIMMLIMMILMMMIIMIMMIETMNMTTCNNIHHQNVFQFKYKSIIRLKNFVIKSTVIWFSTEINLHKNGCGIHFGQ